MISDDRTTHFPGPLSLENAKTKLNLSKPLADEAFTRDGPRAFVEYRDLGLSEATGGKVGAKHIRAIRPFDKETGWHWHDMTGHFIYVLKGWVRFRFDDVENEVTVKAGSCLSQPGGVPHNVVRALVPGKHESTLDYGIFKQVRQFLKNHRTGQGGCRHQTGTLFTGLVFDEHNSRMSLNFSVKGRVQYPSHANSALLKLDA